jgi:hypothetical protein
MVMTSAQISQMTGQFQMQHMGQMQHAAMLSQQAGRQTSGENVMGQAMNYGAGIGAPIASAGMALAGVDPMSMMVRGGMAGFAAGGLAGAAGGAALGGAAIGVPLMAAQYGGQQMMQGAQQQQQLNAALRQNYGFMGQHGRGFTQGEMGDIGSSLRGMTGRDMGSQQMVGFEELGQLASRMGQMGLGGQGARDAFEFNDKFKTMLKQVKEIAEAFNTSLEQAQQIMGGMRSSGIFKNQGQIASQIRDISMSAGLATSEVTGMMNVGSQFSRMLGGRGSSGAVGGMKTIEQIGMAQQTGMLSEERLYDLTGQTGAAGRRALATSRMQNASRFLRGGLGRRMIASMAGEGGMLDEDSAAEWDSGTVGTGRTMEMAGQNLGKVGRAGFIRNEGRLRGEALKKFGGMAHIAAMTSWLDQRGMDAGSDRGLIFMSRRLGISVEEAEQQIKEYRAQDFMRGQAADRKQDAAFRKDIDRQHAKSGLSGVKKKFEDARSAVQNKLRQFGADFYQSGADEIDKWASRITGEYLVSVDRDVGSAIRTAMSGVGDRSDKVMQQRFGLGQGKYSLRGMDEGKRIRGQLLGDAGEADLSPGGAARSFDDRGGASRYRAAGWKVDQFSDLARVRKIQSAGMEGMIDKGAREQVRGFSKENMLNLSRAMSLGAIQGRGDAFLKGMGDQIANMGDPEMIAAWEAADDEGKARIAREIGAATGNSGVVDVAMGSVKTKGGFAGGGWRTAGQMEAGYGDLLRGVRDVGYDTKRRERVEQVSMLARGAFNVGMGGVGQGLGLGLGVGEGKGQGRLKELRGKFGAAVGGAYGTLMDAAGSERGKVVRRALASQVTGAFGSLLGLDDTLYGMTEEEAGELSPEARKAAARFMLTEKGRDLAQGVLSMDSATSAGASASALEQSKQMLIEAGGNPNEMNVLDRGKYEALRATSIAGIYAKYADKEANGTLTEADKAERLKELKSAGAGRKGASDEELLAAGKQYFRMTAGVAYEKQIQARREMFRRVGIQGRKDVTKMRELGIISGGKLTSGVRTITKGGKDVEVEGTMERFAGIGGDQNEDVAKGLAGLSKEARAALESILPDGQKPESLSAGQLTMALARAATMEESKMTEYSEDGQPVLNAQELRGLSTSAAGSMSVSSMKAMADKYKEEGDRGAERYMRSLAGTTTKLKRVSGSGDEAMFGRVVGRELGVSLSNKELRRLRAEKGTDLSEVAKTLMEEGGVTGAGIEEQLTKALTMSREGKSGDAAALLTSLKTDFAEGARKKQDKKADENDPGYRRLGEIKAAIEDGFNKELKARVTNPDEISGGDDPEGDGGGKGKRAARK